MTLTEKLLFAIGPILTGAMSFWVANKRNQTDKELGQSKTADEHTETILGGYSQIVDDLRGEVERLNSIISELREEQEECERRNEELGKVVEELRRRVTFLERTTND